MVQFPEIAGLPGRRRGEGGLLHRLDYETQGLLLIARSGTGMEALLKQQLEGKIFKEYSAISSKVQGGLEGFPPERPELPQIFLSPNQEGKVQGNIRSAFRPYGPGRKAVRPVLAGRAAFGAKKKETVLDRGLPYDTEVLDALPLGGETFSFHLRIVRGFRHQIRCHLAWLSWPLLNDSLYGGSPAGSGLLALRAHSLVFQDPASGKDRFYSIPPLAPEDI
jgi:23S rRNA pseudouridine1911/1915/1917 synthase